MTRIRTRQAPGRAAALAGAALLALAACKEEEEDGRAGGPLYRSELGAVAATDQRPGDPEAGRRALLNAPYVSCGIPYDAYRRVAPETDAADRLPERGGRNAELPYALTAHVNAEGVEIVSSNCLTCHAGRIEGELIVGLGNEFADFTTDPRRLALQAGSYVRGAAETEAWAHWADRIDGIAPHIRTRTVGVNPATNLTWALMAHRDPETLAWSATPLIDPPPAEPLPLSVPPWWNMAKKTAMFYTTIGRGDHAHFMLLASMLCVESPDELAEIDDYAPDIRAYIASLEAPDWPWEIDADLAARGEAIFVRECSDCHGTYGAEESYPNRVYGLDEIGTDPAYARAATDGSRDRFYAWVARSPYGDAETAAPAPGYIAPPLDGIWATAPYLHNGSVPSMAALLAPETRPTYWRHETTPRSYDRDAMGWRHASLPYGQAAETDPAVRREIYDTTLEGYGNGGHAYGADLGAADRAALIEYLKSL
jgi:mono/diheme cytochrome c family protein